MNVLFVFGLILLVICLAVYPKMQKEVVKPLCKDDRKNVSDNKKYFTIFMVISIIMTIVGGIMMII